MNKTKVIKGFDCIKMKHQWQARIVRATKGMTVNQEINYIHDQVNNGEFGDIWRNLGKRASKAA